jgi:hypothetical protein
MCFLQSDDDDVDSRRRKRKIQVQVKAPPSKQQKTVLKPVPSIFQESSGELGSG